MFVLVLLSALRRVRRIEQSYDLDLVDVDLGVDLGTEWFVAISYRF